MYYPLQHPEISALFADLLENLIGESDRGAVLIGAAHVDNHLRRLFEAVFPSDLSKTKRNALLNYPGPLSTYSAKVEVAYALRLLPRNVYDALHALRRIRNDVAHSPESFVLVGQEERVRQMYALDPDLPDGIRAFALEMMLDYKVHVIVEKARELQLDEEYADIEPFLNSKQDAVRFISEHPDLGDSFKQQLPQWELAVGIFFLCSMIVFHRDRVASPLQSTLR